MGGPVGIRTRGVNMKMKFTVTGVAKSSFHKKGYSASLKPTEGCGEIVLHEVEPNEFTVGKEYCVDFTPAEPPVVLT